MKELAQINGTALEDKPMWGSMSKDGPPKLLFNGAPAGGGGGAANPFAALGGPPPPGERVEPRLRPAQALVGR